MTVTSSTWSAPYEKRAIEQPTFKIVPWPWAWAWNVPLQKPATASSLGNHRSNGWMRKDAMKIEMKLANSTASRHSLTGLISQLKFNACRAADEWSKVKCYFQNSSILEPVGGQFVAWSSDSQHSNVCTRKMRQKSFFVRRSFLFFFWASWLRYQVLISWHQ